MATLAELIAEKNRRLEEIPVKFQGSVERLQKQIFNRIIELVGQLQTRNGDILMSQKNLVIAQEINDELKKVLNQREYVKAVRDFAKEFGVQKRVNDDYFEKAFGDFRPSSLANQLVKNAQRNAIELLAGSAAEENFLAPVRTQLEQAVASGASFQETVKGLRELVEGTDEAEGRLLRYAKQVSWDAMATADRAYTNAIAEELELEWFLYSGGTVRDTRCFCEERNGRYFHFKEIEAWGRMENLGDCRVDAGGWAGMMKGTNEKTIFITAGGYNCRHSIMPVSIAIVPEDVVSRNEGNGNYTP